VWQRLQERRQRTTSPTRKKKITVIVTKRSLQILHCGVKSLESLLVEKGLVDRAALDALIDSYEHKIGPRNGARVVARAWADPAYKQRLLTDADAAIAELGYGGMQGEHMRVVENTPNVHNLVVCTLCSCYPWPVLGLPPVWYKSAPYRSRSVIDPRGVLREFGVELGEDVDVRVWDSTAELRYLVASGAACRDRETKPKGRWPRWSHAMRWWAWPRSRRGGKETPHERRT